MTFDDAKRAVNESPKKEVGSGATDKEILEAEQRLGVKIPGDFRDFLATFGWGGTGAFELYGLGRDVPQHLDLVRVTESERSEMMPRLPFRLLPIMNDGGGNLYCLDCDMENPPVVLWDHEAGAEQVPIIEATSFGEWFSLLIQKELQSQVT